MVPHTMVGSSARDASTYFCTGDFSASSAALALSFSSASSTWVRDLEDRGRRVVIGLRDVSLSCLTTVERRDSMVEIKVMVRQRGDFQT